MWTDVQNVGEILSAHVVVGLDEDLAESAFADWIVFRVELVKTVKCVPILHTFK